MNIYMDENMPRHIAEGFQILQYPEGFKTGVQVNVKYLPAEFGSGTKDPDWIPQTGQKKDCVITLDKNIHRRKHELELYRSHGLGMFFLSGKTKKEALSIWEMVELLAKHWPRIIDAALNDERPFAYEVKLKGPIKKLN